MRIHGHRPRRSCARLIEEHPRKLVVAVVLIESECGGHLLLVDLVVDEEVALLTPARFVRPS
jgi:hypothetical protein